MENYLYYIVASNVALIIIYFLSKKYFLFRKILIGLYILTMSSYILWRGFYTLPDSSVISMILGAALLIAEIGSFILSLLFYFLFWQKNTKEEKELAALFPNYPTVDIFIATYNESAEILKRTIVASSKINYPDLQKVQVYILDDGDREEIALLAEELHVNYIRRDDNAHAKAGNLNHGLTKSKGELIVTLDADMIPRVDFLEKTIGYFENPKMGFIQAPQTFFNNDPYQFNLFSENNLNNDQDFFMRRIENQKDIYNSVMYIGSNAVFRRTAIDSIGGFSTGVITEDLATGMFIQAKGWETRFVNKNLASGLAPENFADLIKQRDRWSRGNIQVARKWSPLKVKGLSKVQKFLYMDGIHYWFSGIYKMIFMLAPLWFVLLGFYSLNATFTGILIFWLPSFFASQLAFNRVSQGTQSILLTNIYETVMAPFISYAVISEAVLKSKKGFSVTNKGYNTSKKYYNWRLSLPLLILLILSVIALAKSLLIIFDVLPFPDGKTALYINAFWLMYNVFILIFAVLVPFERPRFRKSERFASSEKAQILDARGQLIDACTMVDWNELGAGLVIDHSDLPDIEIGQKVLLNINGYQLESVVRRVRPEKDTLYVGLSFLALDYDQYAYIITQTYAIASDKLPIKEERPNKMTKVLLSLLKGHLSFRK
ncbi:glycosyltransferase family 2 protein [Lactococcus paracarnosus]|uniref:cellulose synthase (UDP-forming) n=1 Tax=Pseudolactococcus paracarnosus TaxID=2749962 RepID=A0ABT0ANK6_9LACT|nr:glycosyltransferase family 2 protein [Lactococcus paracarnosus]MCJ1978146.1 glycosyltransferase [Lactococcus paracarnosus]MCJ1984279.1 glycosyltransferase [Lactococcus paracarnosus]MCJ1998571.1 glycosyltransferase [Lactococcus paracarnosus]